MKTSKTKSPMLYSRLLPYLFLLKTSKTKSEVMQVILEHDPQLALKTSKTKRRAGGIALTPTDAQIVENKQD